MSHALSTHRHRTDEIHGNTGEEDEELRQALAALAQRYSTDLRHLINESQRCKQLAASLEGEGPRQSMVDKGHQLNDAILQLLVSWQGIGGQIVFLRPESLPGHRPIIMPMVLGQPPAQHHPPNRPMPSHSAQDLTFLGLDEEPAPPPEGVQAPTADDTEQESPVTTPSSADAPPPTITKPSEAPREPIAPVADWVEDLAELLEEIPFSNNAHDEMENIQRCANQSFSRWPNYPRSVQRALVGNLACRLRHLQDHLSVTGPRMDAAFRSLTRYSKSYQPGWVNGLTRGRGPAANSWADEACCWWDQVATTAANTEFQPNPRAHAPAAESHLDTISRWLDEWRSAPDIAKPMCLEKTLEAIRNARSQGLSATHPMLCRLAGEIYDFLAVPDFIRLRQAIRDIEMAEQEDGQDTGHEEIPPDWPWWSHTVGRRSVFIAPPSTESRRASLERAFGLASLLWLTPTDDLQADRDQICEMVLGGQIDLVVLDRHPPHARLNHHLVRCCQESGVAWVLVEKRLGVTRVRLAIERFLQPDPMGIQR